MLINVTGDDGQDGNPPAPDPDNNADQQPPKNDDDSDVEVKPPPKNFLESDRLAYIVNAIEYECAIAPVGAYRITPKHELRYGDGIDLDITTRSRA